MRRRLHPTLVWEHPLVGRLCCEHEVGQARAACSSRRIWTLVTSRAVERFALADVRRSQTRHCAPQLLICRACCNCACWHYNNVLISDSILLQRVLHRQTSAALQLFSPTFAETFFKFSCPSLTTGCFLIRPCVFGVTDAKRFHNEPRFRFWRQFFSGGSD